MIPPEVRFDPATGRVAVRTEMPEPRTWFVFVPAGGGHYATGERAPDLVTDWPVYVAPDLDTVG